MQASVKRLNGRALLWCVGAMALTAAARADVITDWNLTTQQVLVAKSHQGPPGYAFVHVPMYDAVNAIDGGHQVFAVRPTTNPRGASKEAAAASAAYHTLLGEYPDQADMLLTAYNTSLAAIPNGPAKTKGMTIGQEVATAWLALRVNDGREASVPYTFGPTEVGVYQRTAPGANAVAPWLAVMQPFAMTRVSQFRAPGPPDTTSDLYAKDLKFTQSMGSVNSTVRSAEETEIARFYTESPTTYFSNNLRQFAATKNLGISGNARLFAQVFVTAADSMIACWDSKYYYNFWRPSTAIQTTLEDGNPETASEPGWLPVVPTPGHPEYPAGHGCVSTGWAEALRHYFGTSHVKVTLTSTVANSVPHVFKNTEEMVDEVIIARIAGGMHFQNSLQDGVTIGRKVARLVARNHFYPVGKK